MAGRCSVILIERDMVRVLVGRHTSAGVRVERTACAHLDDQNADLARAIGTLGLPKGAMVLAVPRADTVLKLFDVPAELESTGEWLSMAKLQLERHLQTAASDSVLDAMLVRAASGSQSVAGAVRQSLIERVRDACGDVGLKLEGAEMRAAGIAMFGAGAPAVIVAPGATTTEIVIANGGIPVFARSIDASSGIGDPELGEVDRIAARAAVEVKRTLIGARAAGVDERVDRLMVLGEGRLADGIASACELELGLRPEPAGIPVDWPDSVSQDDRRFYLPLAGVVARRASSIDAIDFASPHNPPDTGARRRQLALLVLLAIVAVVGGLVVASSMHLSRLESKLARAESEAGEKFSQLANFQARDARVAHAERWIRGGEQWVPALDQIARAVGAVGGVSLEELRADARIGIGFERGERVPYPGTWTRESRATFRISGAGSDPEGARALRQAFLDGGTFHVLTQGPDAGSEFTYDLIKTSRESDGERP